jgi:hypothetical protein
MLTPLGWYLLQICGAGVTMIGQPLLQKPAAVYEVHIS